MISGIDYGRGNDESCTITFVNPEYIKELEEENQQLKDRINKAIEYMKEHESEPVDYYGTLFYELGQYEKILDLLKGDKE